MAERLLALPEGADARSRLTDRRGGSLSGTILLVDDDEIFRYAATRYLTLAGFEVVAAADTMAALREIDSGRAIDLLITDISMPPGSPHGFALANMLRHRNADLPVLFVTGYRELLEAQSSVPGKTFHKPVDLELIAEEARALLVA